MLLDKRTIEDNYLSVMKFQDVFYVDQIEATRNLTKMHFLNFVFVAQLPFDTLIKLICVSPPTVWNMSEDKRFRLIVADRLMTVINTYALAYKLWGDRENANHWMQQRQEKLDMRAPVELMETYPGIMKLRDFIHHLTCQKLNVINDKRREVLLEQDTKYVSL